MPLDPIVLKTLAIEMAAAMPPPPPRSGSDPLFQQIDRSPRAKALRRIAEIAGSRGWQSEIAKTIDLHDASDIAELDDSAIISLRERMEYYEDCVQFCCDPEDAPPAR